MCVLNVYLNKSSSYTVDVFYIGIKMLFETNIVQMSVCNVIGLFERFTLQFFRKSFYLLTRRDHDRLCVFSQESCAEQSITYSAASFFHMNMALQVLHVYGLKKTSPWSQADNAAAAIKINDCFLSG